MAPNQKRGRLHQRSGRHERLHFRQSSPGDRSRHAHDVHRGCDRRRGAQRADPVGDVQLLPVEHQAPHVRPRQPKLSTEASLRARC